jgi:hypothetical protein
MNPTRAHYRIATVTPVAVLIIDLDDGATTVTNDAEAVVAGILELYPQPAEHSDKPRRIVYRDTEGDWSELLHDGTKFTGYAAITAAEQSACSLIQ